MKKMLFLAIAMIAFVGNTYANQSNNAYVIKDITNKLGVCEYSISLVRIVKGKKIVETKDFIVVAKDQKDCESKAADHTRKLNLGLIKW